MSVAEIDCYIGELRSRRGNDVIARQHRRVVPADHRQRQGAADPSSGVEAVRRGEAEESVHDGGAGGFDTRVGPSVRDDATQDTVDFRRRVKPWRWRC
jgi:hypothetical protein